MTTRFSYLFPVLAMLLAMVGAHTARAQENQPEDAILVLDASGSMWGQIVETPKISIARDVINGLLDDLPPTRRLGLVAYGHNRKGDCGDIEELAPVGTDRQAIRDAMRELNPKGKTPLSASVKFAAEKLKHTENRATVILVSDGIETCDLDPCEVGASLEATGVDFTTHVIGFDITEEKDRAGLQCLAEATGGAYLNATDANELSDALGETIVEAPGVAADGPTGLTLRATELTGGPEVTSGLAWEIRKSGDDAVAFDASDVGTVEAELSAGVYDISVSRASDGLKGSAKNVELRPGVQKTVTIALEFDLEASLRLVPAEKGPVNGELIVHWEGPERDGDWITITETDGAPGSWKSYKYTREGNPVKLRIPVEPGVYEVRYVLGKPTRVLARKTFTAIALDASLDAPDSVAAGADFEVAWEGPGYNDDWLTVVKPDAGPKAYTSYEYTRKGNPLTLEAPLEAGDYELRYVLSGDEVIARRPITVTGVEATVSGPTEAMAGTSQTVTWTGPGGKSDWITVIEPDARENRYNDYAYTRDGETLDLLMPLEAGEYEFRYVQDGKKVIARQPVTITAAQATLDTPTTVKVNETVDIRWTGPDQRGDWITVVKPDEAENRYTDYDYPGRKDAIDLIMPLEPGAYEFRYVLNGRKVIARKPVTIEDVTATISAPARVKANEMFTVTFEGPNFHRDWITLAEPGATDNAYLASSYKYTRDGSPLQLRAPTDPGEYELRYTLGGKRVLARQKVVVE